MRIISAFTLAMMVVALSVSDVNARKKGKSPGYRPPPQAQTWPAPGLRGRADLRRDPLGIIQRQGVSSLYGGMGNMGGGSGRSANTGVGLGAHGNSQGPRF